MKQQDDSRHSQIVMYGSTTRLHGSFAIIFQVVHFSYAHRSKDLSNPIFWKPGGTGRFFVLQLPILVDDIHLVPPKKI